MYPIKCIAYVLFFALCVLAPAQAEKHDDPWTLSMRALHREVVRRDSLHREVVRRDSDDYYKDVIFVLLEHDESQVIRPHAQIAPHERCKKFLADFRKSIENNTPVFLTFLSPPQVTGKVLEVYCIRPNGAVENPWPNCKVSAHTSCHPQVEVLKPRFSQPENPAHSSISAAAKELGDPKELPPYPPVACVTPDWTPEPCESRFKGPQSVPAQATKRRVELPEQVIITGPDDKHKPLADIVREARAANPGKIIYLYFEPGASSFPQFTAEDKLLIARGRTTKLPPVEYDHPFEGRLLIVPTEFTAEQMRDFCQGTDFGCTSGKLDPEKQLAERKADCIIVLAPEDRVKKLGSTLNLVIRHEIGHGWPQDHRGAR